MKIDLWIEYNEANTFLDDIVRRFDLLEELMGPQVTYCPAPAPPFGISRPCPTPTNNIASQKCLYLS